MHGAGSDNEGMRAGWLTAWAGNPVKGSKVDRPLPRLQYLPHCNTCHTCNTCQLVTLGGGVSTKKQTKKANPSNITNTWCWNCLFAGWARMRSLFKAVQTFRNLFPYRRNPRNGNWSLGDWLHLRLSEQSARSRINPVAVFVVYQYCICPPLPRIWIQLMDRPTAL